MKAYRLDTLAANGFALDTETHLIQPGLVSPPMVLGSSAMVVNNAMQGELLDKDATRRVFDTFLTDNRFVGIFANAPFDLLVLIVDAARRGIDLVPQVFAALDPYQGAIRGDVDGRVYDILIAQALHAIANGQLGFHPRTGQKMEGRYSLDATTEQVLGRGNAKANDRFRLSYALFDGVPLAELPPEARTYPVDDAINTLEVALAQAGLVPRAVAGPTGGNAFTRFRNDNAHEISRNTYVAFCLALGAAWGFAVDQRMVDALERKYHDEHDGQRQPFIDSGVFRANGTEDRKVLKGKILAAYLGNRSAPPCPECLGKTDNKGRSVPGRVPSEATAGATLVACKACDGTALELPPEVPRSDSGQIAFGADVLAESGDDFLMSLAGYKAAQKIATVYIPYLRSTDREGVPHPDVPLLLRPNLQPLETGRRSYDGATMLLPRTGGVRECIIARPGRILSSSDYKAGELVTHAQDCLEMVGASNLAEALIRGLDAHTALAGTIVGVSYDELQARRKRGDKAAGNSRQCAKPPNFGFPGRMGAAALVKQQRKQNDVHTPHPSGGAMLDDGKGGKVRGYKGMRFCILMGRADRCGEVKVTEWKGRTYPPLCKKCIECAEDLKKAWLLQWPENVKYFEIVKALDEGGKPIVQFVSNRLRGFKHGQVDADGEPMNSGNAIANGFFQARLADAALNALMTATRECYDPTVRVASHTFVTSAYEGLQSPLYGSRIPQFQHDELIGDHPEDMAHDGSMRIGEIMCEALRIVCPDMGKEGSKAIEATPALMRRMYKGAEAVHDSNGRLIPWEPAYK